MKKSINAWTFPEAMTFEDIFSEAKKYGFQAIELNFDKVGRGPHSLTLETTKDDIDEIKRLIEKYGITVESVSSSMYGLVGAFGDPSEEKRCEAVATLKHHLWLAKSIGADSILVVPKVALGQRLLESMDNTIATFRSLKDEIAKYGVKIGLENVWNCFFSSPFDIKYVLDGIGDPNVGLYFDMGNVVEFADTDWWIDTIGKYIVKVHVKDFKRTKAYRSGGAFCDLLEGDLNWEKAMPLIAKYYDGPLTTEVSRGNRTAEEYYPKLSEALDKIIGMVGGATI